MDILYVGSTSVGIKRLEENHRGAREKDYSMTKFRLALEENHKESGSFEWLVKPDLRTLREVEELERDLIKKYLPFYNLDYDPVASSEKHKRYDLEESQKKKYRGVYCFKDNNG